MREVRFRAWDKKRKQMYPVDNINFRKELINVFEPEDIGSYCSGHIERPFKRIILQQYSDKQDTSELLICEGDIVEASIYADEKPQVLEVNYIGSAFAINYEDGESDCVLLSEFPGTLRIVGNIHENPDLLEQEVK